MIKLIVTHVSTKDQKTQTNLTFSTKESISEIDRIAMQGSPGILLFEKDFKKEGIEQAIRDTELGVDFGKYSPSKRLRGKLYEYWYNHVTDEDWEDWYVRKMDGVLEFMTKQLK